MKLRIKISNTGYLNTNERQRAYLIKYSGKEFVGSVDERANPEKQKFIEGAIVPYFYYQHLPGVFSTFKDAREALKFACNSVEYVFDHNGKRRTQTRSMAQIYANKSATQAFIDGCQEYFMKNGYLFPNSEEYNEWLNSSPPVDEIYPPLLELKNDYDAQVHKSYPWRK